MSILNEPIVAGLNQIINDRTKAIDIPKQATASAQAAIVADAAPVIAAQLQPVIDNLTNNEPFYQSRVTLGALFAVVGSFCAAFGIRWLTPEQTVATINLIAILAPVVGGAAFTLYGRWKAKRPIGS